MLNCQRVDYKQLHVIWRIWEAKQNTRNMAALMTLDDTGLNKWILHAAKNWDDVYPWDMAFYQPNMSQYREIH